MYSRVADPDSLRGLDMFFFSRFGFCAFRVRSESGARSTIPDPGTTYLFLDWDPVPQVAEQSDQLLHEVQVAHASSLQVSPS